MHYRQKFGENPSMHIGDIGETNLKKRYFLAYFVMTIWDYTL